MAAPSEAINVNEEYLDQVAPAPEAEIWPSPTKPKFAVTHSPTFGKLVGALAKAKLEFKPIVKQNENDAFTRGNRKSFYADLAAYIDATQEALAKNGLVVLQWPEVLTDAKSMTLESILAHESGEWMRGKLTLPAEGSQWKDGKHSTVFNPQTCGSAITYARRFSYAAIVGAAAEDDDGNSASDQGSKAAAQAVGQKKIEELKQKMGNGPAQIDGMIVDPLTIYYTWYDASQTALISATPDMLEKHKKIIHALTTKVEGKLIADGEQLDKLMYEFEHIGVPFKKFKTVPVKAAGA